MRTPELDPALRPALEKVLGYLNFSSGQVDPQFLARLNQIWEAVEGPILSRPATRKAAAEPAAEEPPVWKRMEEVLRRGLDDLSRELPSFRDADHARRTLDLVFQHILPGYLAFHRDLLFHQPPERIFRPLFIGRVCEMALRHVSSSSRLEELAEKSIAQLNDFVGHRPVAVLERQRMEPYAHEFVRPIPLYICEAGVACGRHRAVIEIALEILRETDEDLLREACFDFNRLDELAIDPRAYDFDHPANKRPNYHFGQWDPNLIDGRGNFRRFVVQEVTFESLLDRVENTSDLPAEETLFEGAAVLAGTMLMASGVSGSGPDSFDSNTTLATLLPRIAAYRDRFYEQLISRLKGTHARRLQAEAAEKRQPFGGARQHLNAQLARRRACQLEHVHLAKVYAKLGHPEGAQQQVDVVPAASARITCRIDCLLTAGHQAVEAGQPQRGADILVEIQALLKRGIECGAIVDPWNILGFDAQYSLFPAAENSIRDHRVDELVALVEQIFNLYSRVWSEGAARDDQPLAARVQREFQRTTRWWNQFAAHEVASVEAVRGDLAFAAAQHVAEALRLWHKGGARTGDVKFWAPYTQMFDSPQAYALVIEALLERRDFVAAMALLVQWLGEAGRIRLEHGESSFHKLAIRWMRAWRSGEPVPANDPDAPVDEAATRWPLFRKFLDYLEANAESYGEVPQFELARRGQKPKPQPPSEAPEKESSGDEDEEEGQDLFRAAYENVVYHDTTDDGIEGSIFEPGGATTDEELEHESKRVTERLEFLNGLARLWKAAALWPRSSSREKSPAPRFEFLERCAQTAAARLNRLLELLRAIAEHPLPAASGDHDSLLEYDRHRMLKETLLERVIGASVEMADAARLLLAAAGADSGQAAGVVPIEWPVKDSAEQRVVPEIFRAILLADVEAIRKRWPDLVEAFASQPLLYVPLNKGGDPQKIVAARIRQRTLQDLLSWLPRLGLLQETCQLLELARQMEKDHPVGPAAVTEFDALFEIGFRALVDSVVVSSRRWKETAKASTEPDAEAQVEKELVGSLDILSQALLGLWHAHSGTLRLSTLERVQEPKEWQRLVKFIEAHGRDLFTQRFMNLGNLRAILHQGVDNWIAKLLELPDAETKFQFLEQIGRKLNRNEAVKQLTLVLESIVENYSEYRDYNSTTTQSDRGELLYTLLDFLRLRSNYDRVAWNLKPLVIAHEVLVRRGAIEAAQLWRRKMQVRVREESGRFMERLGQLQKMYAMRMPTVADRLAEGFIRPMTIDRLRAFVEPARRRLPDEPPSEAFTQLAAEAELMMQVPSGVGLDVPPWLVALEEEVERIRNAAQLFGPAAAAADLDAILPQRPLSLEEMYLQLTQLQLPGEGEKRKS